MTIQIPAPVKRWGSADTNIRMILMQPITTNGKIADGTKEKPELLYPELSYKVTGLCFGVHNELGQFAREKQYGDLLEEKFKEAGLVYTRECRIGEEGNIPDFIIENSIALELKAKRIILASDFRRPQNYLQTSLLKLGLLVNFRNKYLKPERVVRIEKYVIK